MPQTIEAINHAKARQVPMIVAINKIDRPTRTLTKCVPILLQHEVIVEKMSGEVQDVEVSAITVRVLISCLRRLRFSPKSWS